MLKKSKQQHIYILVHGAWHGSWCWEEVVRKLEDQGHKAIAPDLPGHGEDNLWLNNISLKTYVDFIEDLVLAQEASVILVGHSMAGVIISQVAENIPEKIKKLVYVAAFIPENNGSLMQEARQGSTAGVSTETRVDELNNEIILNKSERAKELFFNCCNEKQAEHALLKLQANEPFRPFVDTVEISQARFGKVDKLYIECLNDNAVTIEDQRRMCGKIPLEILRIDTDHSPFISRVGQLTEALCSC